MIAYVVGAGAVGRFLGERLRSERTEIVYAPRALEDVVPVEAGLAIVAVKSYDTAGAIATLRAALGQATEATILCVQNGVGNEELLAAAFGPDAVVAGALTIPVALAQD
ncbi:MAG: ketopantoate reductase family protein, partial [Vulcanimicrobiaceae bacterium]